MFIHIYKNRLKCIIRDKETMFWCLAFPLLLASLFSVVLAGVMKEDRLDRMPIAVVDHEMIQQDILLQEMFAYTEMIFEIQYLTISEADTLLHDEQIEGYIFYDEEIKLAVKKVGSNKQS